MELQKNILSSEAIDDDTSGDCEVMILSSTQDSTGHLGVDHYQKQISLKKSSSRVEEEDFARPSAKSRRKAKRANSAEDSDGRAEETYRITQSALDKDDFSTYGQHVGNELRKLNWNACQLAKHHINNVLFDAAMGRFDHSLPLQQYSNPATTCSTPTPAQSPIMSEYAIAPAGPPHMIHGNLQAKQYIPPVRDSQFPFDDLLNI